MRFYDKKRDGPKNKLTITGCKVEEFIQQAAGNDLPAQHSSEIIFPGEITIRNPGEKYIIRESDYGSAPITIAGSNLTVEIDKCSDKHGFVDVKSFLN